MTRTFPFILINMNIYIPTYINIFPSVVPIAMFPLNSCRHRVYAPFSLFCSFMLLRCLPFHKYNSLSDPHVTNPDMFSFIMKLLLHSLIPTQSLIFTSTSISRIIRVLRPIYIHIYIVPKLELLNSLSSSIISNSSSSCFDRVIIFLEIILFTFPYIFEFNVEEDCTGLQSFHHHIDKWELNFYLDSLMMSSYLILYIYIYIPNICNLSYHSQNHISHFSALNFFPLMPLFSFHNQRSFLLALEFEALSSPELIP